MSDKIIKLPTNESPMSIHVNILDEYEDILTVDDVCKILKIGRNTAYKMLQDKEIPNRRVRHRYIIPKLGLANYLTKISGL